MIFNYTLIIFIVFIFQINQIYSLDDSDLVDNSFIHRSSENIHSDVDEVFQPVTNFVKGVCREKGAEAIRSMMQGHYKQLRLMNADNEWEEALLRHDTDKLLPENLSMENIDSFVEHIAKLATQNPILIEIMNHLIREDHGEFFEKIRDQTHHVIPDALAYTLVLNNMTKMQVQDIRFLEDLNIIWNRESSGLFVPKYFSLFETAKYYTIRGLPGVIDAQRARYVVPSSCKYFLSFNIAEATVADMLMGNLKNAYAGYVMAVHPPGVEEDPITGAGPSLYDFDPQFPHGGVVALFSPFQGEWANLYSAWNLGFVSTFPEFPYFAAKLLNPQVLDYQNHPSHYMYNRVLALHAHANWLLFRRVDESQGLVQPIDWRHEPITNIFGMVNAEYASAYKNKVAERRA